MKKFCLLLSLVALLFTSCLPKKEIIYLQGAQNSDNSSTNYEPLIQRDDILFINISSREAEAVSAFNLDSQTSKDLNSTTSGYTSLKQSYLVDNIGNIEFPIIGTINVAGYSINEFREVLKGKLKRIR